MQPNKRRRRSYDLAALQAVGGSGCQGEAGLQARADDTVTVEHSKMPSNALQYMQGQKVPILGPQHKCMILAGCKCEHSWSCAVISASAVLQQSVFQQQSSIFQNLALKALH